MNTDLLKTEVLLDLSNSIAGKYLKNYDFPWEILSDIGDIIKKIGSTLSPDEYDLAGDDIWISKTAKVAATASITGPVIICPGAEVRHCAFIRGKVIIGSGAVAGNSCEFKNSIIFDGAQIPHFSYVGDSVLGYKAHFGAGVITSNLKSDKSPVAVSVEGEKLPTGIKKFGAIVGDFAEIGCNTVLNPGTIVGRQSTIYPLSMVRGYVKSCSVYKKQGEICEKIENFN